MTAASASRSLRDDAPRAVATTSRRAAAEGAFKIVRAIQHRRMPARGWLVFDGILSLALAIMILAIWPGAAVWVLGLIVGINLLFGGISMLLIGLGAGPVLPARP